MKILLYTELEKAIAKSGLGKAIKHQMQALEENNIEYTTNSHDDYDIVHINFYGLKSFFIAKEAKKKGKKVIYHAHSTEEDFRNSFKLSNQIAPAFKKWIMTCYSLGDHILTPTPYAKRLLKGYGLENPITAISNGIDVKFFEKNEKLGKKFREKYHYTKDDKVIMGVGLYIERKGILDFVELAKRLPQYKFIWFGYSSLAYSPKKISDAVHTKLDNLFFAGYVEPEELRCAYSGADLYLFPTLEETEGIPIIEACAARIPSLIRDIPVFDEWLIDGVNVYKAKNIDEFEDKIKKILDGKLPNLTNEGYKVACERDIKKVGKDLINIYKQVLESPSFEYLQNEKKIKAKEKRIIEKYRLKEGKEIRKLKNKLDKYKEKENKKVGKEHEEN
ncbi:MAG: glycosyltransferase family 4 protein [Bacilli bacterium]|nr:glycosyltransferase family 4 protein [Bacilli bacterium]